MERIEHGADALFIGKRCHSTSLLYFIFISGPLQHHITAQRGLCHTSSKNVAKPANPLNNHLVGITALLIFQKAKKR